MKKAANDQPVWHKIRKSEVHGNGVFALADIRAGARILEYLGEKITKKESDRRGWAQFDLLGHSRGAIISAILASTIPERIGHLVLLDAMSAPSVPEQDFPQQMAKFLQDKPRLLKHRGRYYSTEEKAIAARTKNGLSAQAARALARRGGWFPVFPENRL